MNRLVSLLILICLTSFAYAGGPGQGASVHTLVIDPGHGGLDPGAIGPGGHHEAELALAVSLKFGEMVKEAFPDVKIIYTRTTDKFVSLADRADMANKAKADLFICIHLNSATTHEAYGTATYVLGLHRTDDNLEIAKRENAVIDLEDNKDKKYEFDPNSPEGHIIMSMKQNAFLDQSILIASKIEDELAVAAKRKSRGVKQAGFWVLYKTAMPSLLAEIGFISNPTEEVYLSSPAGQENIATSIYKAFRSYKFEIEGRKDTQPVLAQATAAEKKKEGLATDQSEPPLKTSPVSPPSKQPLEAETADPQAAKQPAANQQEPKSQQPTTTSQNTAPAKHEDKAWEPDTSIYAQPGQIVRTEKVIVSVPKDNLTNPVVKDTMQPKPATTADNMTKKLVPVRSANDNVPPAKREETKTVKATETKPATTAKTTEPVEAKPVAEKPKTEPKREPVVAKAEPKPATTAKTTEPKNEKPIEAKPVAEKPKAEPKKEPVAKAAPKETAPVSTSSAKIFFTVQIFAAHKPPKNYDELVNTFGLINREEIGDGVVRYMVGQYTHYKEALKILAQVKDKGFPTAFVISYVDDVRQDAVKTKELGTKHP